MYVGADIRVPGQVCLKVKKPEGCGG